MEKEKNDQFLSGDLRTEPLDQIKEAMDDVESKILNKYAEMLQEIEGMNPSEMKLSTKNFEQLYDIFHTSLGKNLTSKDYMALFNSSNIDGFLAKVNELQMKYLRKDTLGLNTGSNQSVTTHDE